MKRDFVLAEHGDDQREVTTGERWVLGYLVHRHGRTVPIHLEAIRIPPLGLHLASGPDEEWIVDVNGLIGEGQETGQSDEDKDCSGKAPQRRACPGDCVGYAFVHLDIGAARERITLLVFYMSQTRRPSQDTKIIVDNAIF